MLREGAAHIGVLVGRQPVCRPRIEVEVGHHTRPGHGVGEQCRMEIGGRYGVGQPTEVGRAGGRPDRGIGVGQQGAADFLRGLGPPLRELGAHRGVRIGGQAGPQIGRRPPVGRGGLTYLRGPVGDERLDQVPGEGRVTAGERRAHRGVIGAYQPALHPDRKVRVAGERVGRPAVTECVDLLGRLLRQIAAPPGRFVAGSAVVKQPPQERNRQSRVPRRRHEYLVGINEDGTTRRGLHSGSCFVGRLFGRRAFSSCAQWGSCSTTLVPLPSCDSQVHVSSSRRRPSGSSVRSEVQCPDAVVPSRRSWT